MTAETPEEHSPASARLGRSGERIERLGPFVGVALGVLGVLLAVDDWAASESRWPAAIARLISWGIAGTVATVALQAAGQAIGLLARRLDRPAAEASPAFERPNPSATAALAGSAPSPAPPPAAVATAAEPPRIAEIRGWIVQGRFEEAARALDELGQDAGLAEAARRLVDELADRRAAHARTLRARLEAAREAGDLDSVLDLRDELSAALADDQRRTLDRELAGWLLLRLQRRLLGGKVAPDLVATATRIADRFAETREGASLRASLPTLRRSAGLCPRCARPYTGIDDACPRCLFGDEPAAENDADPQTDSETESAPRQSDALSDTIAPPSAIRVFPPSVEPGNGEHLPD